MECAVFKSPLPKLVRFFQSSRDKWKEKCLKAKRESKKLANQARAVEKSRERWKQQAKVAQRQVRELERELADLKSSSLPARREPWHRRFG